MPLTIRLCNDIGSLTGAGDIILNTDTNSLSWWQVEECGDGVKLNKAIK